MNDFRARRQQGSMLIIALAVLVLLSLIAVTFAALMRLERRATENYTNLRKTQFIATSAESSVIAMLRGGLFWTGYTQWNEKTAPWIYGVESGKAQYGGRLPLEEATPKQSSYAWHLGSSKPGGWDYFKTKIIDTNSQINLNGDQDTLADMLDALGEAIQKDTDQNSFQANPFRERFKAGTQYKGKDIILFRLKQEGNRFTSKSQLRKIIGDKNYDIVKDYLTTESWVDRQTQRASDGVDRYSNLDEGSSTSVGGQPKILQTSITGSARLSIEKRAPININTAPKPVLIACLQGLGCRRAFPWAAIETQATEEGNAGEIEDALPPTQEELTLRSQPLWVYSTPLEYQHAEKIADAIINHRKATPFKVWQTGQRTSDQGLGFEEFVNLRLSDTGGFFPPPSAIQVINPNEKVKTTRYRGELLNAASPAGRLYAQGHKDAATRRQAGLAVSGRNAFYYDMMRAMLMANFNPNTRINKYNPNHTVYRAVDKSNLVKIDDSGGGLIPRPGHTTEFCFDSGGIYEVTTMASMTGAVGGDATPETDFAGAERFATTKRRTIVKVFEVLRHTTQEDFERPFQSGRFNSVQGRENVTTFPDPITALHEDLWHGSTQDGRVEVIGYEDQKVSGQNISWYEGNAKFPLHYGARYRTEQSKNKLKREYRKNRASNEFRRELGRALDPSHSIAGGNMRKRYSRLEWGAVDDSDEEGNQINEPNVDVVSKGGDLFPDGINSSIFRTSALGTRFLRFPASRYRASPSSQGAINHASDTGNVPYYKGGVAFWIKPEFDGSDPVFWGLVGCTQVQTEVGYDPDSSEGTQFYIWKNTSGELRVSRLYYHQAFIKGETEQAVPDIEQEEDGGQGNEDDIVFDERKTYARTDVYLNVSDWRAHEWRHVAIEWDDEASEGNRVKVWVDFAQQDAGSVDMGAEKFVALNVEEPKDGLYVAGFFRDQAAAQEGLFKFNTNYDSEQKREVAESVKRIPANATIDEFVTFDGGFSRAHGTIGYFTSKTAKYTNAFQMPLPAGIQRVRLRSLAWTVYAPTMYAGRPVRFRPGQDVRMSVAGIEGQQTLLPVRDSGGDSLQNSNIAGRWIYARGTLPEDRVAELVYEVSMRAATGSGGEFGARQVASPALDDVTLTYYLPSAQVLLTEEE